MARNIGMELNLAADKINQVSSNFIPPTLILILVLKVIARHLHLPEYIFEYQVFEKMFLHKFLKS